MDQDIVGGGSFNGGGGGGGGVSIKTVDVVPGDEVSISIASKIATVTHSRSSTLMIANPGTSATTSSPNGGAGGTASGGDYNISGGKGEMVQMDKIGEEDLVAQYLTHLVLIQVLNICILVEYLQLDRAFSFNLILTFFICTQHHL